MSSQTGSESITCRLRVRMSTIQLQETSKMTSIIARLESRKVPQEHVYLNVGFTILPGVGDGVMAGMSICAITPLFVFIC